MAKLSQNTRVVLILAGSFVFAFFACAALAALLLNPAPYGIHCDRALDGGACEVRSSIFLGLLGNSTAHIPRKEVRSADVFCPRSGGRSNPGCYVMLELTAGRRLYGPNFTFEVQAEHAAKRVNDYLNSDSDTSVDISSDLWTPLVMYGVLPPLSVAVLFLFLRRKLGKPNREAGR